MQHERPRWQRRMSHSSLQQIIYSNERNQNFLSTGRKDEWMLHRNPWAQAAAPIASFSFVTKSTKRLTRTWRSQTILTLVTKDVPQLTSVSILYRWFTSSLVLQWNWAERRVPTPALTPTTQPPPTPNTPSRTSVLRFSPLMDRRLRVAVTEVHSLR